MADVGHLCGFGNTEEKFRLMILGCQESGRRADGPLNHWTGRGWVRFRRGQYYDAIYIKHNTVVCFIMETLGGIAPASAHHLRRLAKEAGMPGRRDGTVYKSWTARSFYAHYAQRLSCAAAIEDAKIINRGARVLRQRATRAKGAAA